MHGIITRLAVHVRGITTAEIHLCLVGCNVMSNVNTMDDCRDRNTERPARRRLRYTKWRKHQLHCMHAVLSIRASHASEYPFLSLGKHKTLVLLLGSAFQSLYDTYPIKHLSRNQDLSPLASLLHLSCLEVKLRIETCFRGSFGRNTTDFPNIFIC